MTADLSNVVQIYNAMGDDRKKETKIEKKDEFGNTVEEKNGRKGRRLINSAQLFYLFGICHFNDIYWEKRYKSYPLVFCTTMISVVIGLMYFLTRDFRIKRHI